eukprot:6182051-Pleurochrysis_carterae.AAC.5
MEMLTCCIGEESATCGATRGATFGPTRVTLGAPRCWLPPQAALRTAGVTDTIGESTGRSSLTQGGARGGAEDGANDASGTGSGGGRGIEKGVLGGTAGSCEACLWHTPLAASRVEGMLSSGVLLSRWERSRWSDE